jgi:hypothetical protein
MIIIFIVVILALATKPQPLCLKKYLPRNRRVVCSLTTRPVQPKYFGKVLDRLVEQFDAVYLAVPEKSHKGVVYPKITHPGVTVVPVEEDYGPITKFFGALNSDEKDNTLVVVVDDDIIYNSKLREICEENYKQYPRCVISGAGIVYKYSNLQLPWFFGFTGHREMYPSWLPSFLGSKILTTVCGYASISFRRSLLQREELLDFIKYYNKNEDCFLNDDMVISAFFSTKGISRMWAKIPRCEHESTKDTESLSGMMEGDSIYFRQYRAFQHLRDCFRNDSPRIDCICLFDVILLIIVVIILGI